ncbi:hypothetical protein BpHYR1_039193 [Brachionus plicatilis]|uniref:Uncharacterized protein n=1 Tax=Brachionus plicatilis TaxID=10195 RepID=A0A3M7T6D0_BRAPC|nr:hypothetical protein BpHYR1_039193 [Brachionus plicatilis]
MKNCNVTNLMKSDLIKKKAIPAGIETTQSKRGRVLEPASPKQEKEEFSRIIYNQDRRQQRVHILKSGSIDTIVCQ